jgi:hypothetical protein
VDVLIRDYGSTDGRIYALQPCLKIISVIQEIVRPNVGLEHKAHVQPREQNNLARL